MKGLTPLILILVVIGLYFMYISPTMAQISVWNEQLARYTDTLGKSKELKTRRDSILSSMNAIPSEDIDKLDKILPTESNPVLLAKDISSLAAQSGMPLKQISVTQVDTSKDNPGAIVLQENKEPYKTTRVAFSVTGTYDQFTVFLKNLETGLRLSDVTDISVKSSDKNAAVMEYSVTLNSYSLR